MSGTFLETLSRQSDLAQSTKSIKLKQPRRYKVILLNDDYTPMDFVVCVLTKFFALTEQQATKIMLQVHTGGRGVCGTFTREIAEMKVDQVNHYARQHQHPLLCEMDPES